MLHVKPSYFSALHMASQAGDGERKKRRLIGTVLWFRKISMIDVLRSLNTVVRNYRLFERRRVYIHSLNASHPSRTRVAAAAVDGDDDPQTSADGTHSSDRIIRIFVFALVAR